MSVTDTSMQTDPCVMGSDGNCQHVKMARVATAFSIDGKEHESYRTVAQVPSNGEHYVAATKVLNSIDTSIQQDKELCTWCRRVMVDNTYCDRCGKACHEGCTNGYPFETMDGLDYEIICKRCDYEYEKKKLEELPS
ncbi:hypothetical protein AB0H71_28960 [Nocardia sp. NPDC050697]|uniref:hypothetical protein n=1 Tax=Nocardia sp. NPDC050697 TaxID=3155158 RepID=UPI0034090599